MRNKVMEFPKNYSLKYKNEMSTASLMKSNLNRKPWRHWRDSDEDYEQEICAYVNDIL